MTNVELRNSFYFICIVRVGGILALKEKIENILNYLTDDQHDLFDRNISLWEKTAELNGGPQQSTDLA